MSLAPNSFSAACTSIAEFLGDAIGKEVLVLVGSPANAVPQDSAGKHHVNLFFHRVEPSGFEPGAVCHDPLRLRVHCLVTPFAIAEAEATAGENDLRLLGAVLRAFAERPVLPEIVSDGKRFRVQAVFEPLSLDDLNRLWTTQRDLSLRPSVAYEFALVPLFPESSGEQPSLVGSVRVDVEVSRRSGLPPPSASRRAGWAPPRVDAAREDWLPGIALATPHGWAQVVEATGGAKVRVAVAGRKDADVALAWDVWDRGSGWRPGPEAEPKSAKVVQDAFPPDPARAATAEVAVPSFAGGAAQAVLHASREFSRGSDGAKVRVRSNPVMVVIRGGA